MFHLNRYLLKSPVWAPAARRQHWSDITTSVLSGKVSVWKNAAAPAKHGPAKRLQICKCDGTKKHKSPQMCVGFFEIIALKTAIFGGFFLDFLLFFSSVFLFVATVAAAASPLTNKQRKKKNRAARRRPTGCSLQSRTASDCPCSHACMQKTH